ncbi:hypothetical protein [Ruminococcus sp.]|uniref:hypothetical protein n=1 Tax=Ruminococcus sp. TaxID=41978 RepID=UPI001B63ADB0|nr:hypothetical protein [Ruminococcus sp.]MBP5433745.1 hypothetical protein [Ruminococcus sp.]
MKNENTCCICGKEIPEGRLVCPGCDRRSAYPPPVTEIRREARSGSSSDKAGVILGILNLLMLIAILVKVVSL